MTDIATLRARAILIRDETRNRQNSAQRVGVLLLDLASSGAVITPEAYGATGGGANDTSALNDAIAAALAGDGRLFLAGTYSTTGLTVTAATGLHIFGPGGLLLLPGSNASVLKLVGCTDTTIEGITIDGNRVNQTGLSHGLEASSETNGLIVCCRVTECNGDGIHIGGAGPNIRIRILSGTEIDHVTDEGIYVESIAGVNPGDGYDDLTTALIEAPIIRWHGLTTTANWKAGIHCKTPCNITNPRIHAHGYIGDTSAIGIRLGVGSNRSTVMGGFIFPGVRGNGVIGVFPDFTDATEGIRIEANDCVIDGCSPHGSFWGTRIIGVRNRIHKTISDQCAYGHYAQDAAGFTRFTECGGSGAVGPGIGFLIASDNSWIDGCYARLNAHYGIEVAATASNLTITRCDMTGNTDAPILDGGTETRVLLLGAGGDGTSEWLPIGTSPPTSGLLRLGANQGGVVFRTASGLNAGALELSASNNLNVGDSTDIPRIDYFASSAHRIAVGANTRLEVNDLYSEFRSVNGFGRMYVGTGAPEGSISAPAGSMFLRAAGGSGMTFFVKESGTAATGWVGK